MTLLIAAVGGAAGTNVDVNDAWLSADGRTAWKAGDPTGCEGITGFSPARDAFYGSLNDSFDDGGAMVFAFDEPDSEGYTTNNVKVSGGTLKAPFQDVSGPQMARTETALPHDPTLRSLVALKNPFGGKQTYPVYLSSDLASGALTQVQGTSSGDATFGANDRWIVTASQNGMPPEAPVTEVLFGKGASTPVESVVPVPGVSNGCVTVRFEVTIPKQSTRYLLFFNELQSNTDDSLDAAARFDKLKASSPLLNGIKQKLLPDILNWKLG
jgi:hypothetical protein